jgi:pyruvate-ferredoxin/flavodoxin oxidoreductase
MPPTYRWTGYRIAGGMAMVISELVRTSEVNATGRHRGSDAHRPTITADANEAVASVAYRLSEMIAVYPITPSSAMGEWADTWATAGKPNLWGAVPRVVEMQSEAGAAGALHGAVQSGVMSTTFTASQGLLLMLPNMFKIAGELTPVVFHIAARTVATHALSIFGDHSDVMAARQVGWAMLASSTVQEAQDFAVIAHAATLQARVPFMHFFDGFRTSHEVMKMEPVDDAVLRAMIDERLVHEFRARGLAPEHPHLAGSAQNPDVFFQSREAANPYYLAAPGIVEAAMDRFAELTGRRYHPFTYEGAPDATDVIVAMGSGATTAAATAQALREREGRKVGVLTVHLYRPFAVQSFVKTLPATVERIAVLDRTKEAGAIGEPLYLDVVTAIAEVWNTGEAPFATLPRVIGGRYGLASKEFTPGMAKAVFDALAQPMRHAHFTVGINDDVTGLSLPWDATYDIEAASTNRSMFYGVGSDGTVGANKNSIKIIGDETDLHAQGYFVYDSKKAGSITISHLRFGPEEIRAPYLIREAGFVACHQFALLERLDVLESAAEGATFLLNSPYGPDEVWDKIPHAIRHEIVARKLRFYVIDGDGVAQASGMGRRVNTVMQACFFALSGILPRDEAIDSIKTAIRKSYGKRGERVVQQNFNAVDQALAHLHEVTVPAMPDLHGERILWPPLPKGHGDVTPDYMTAMLIAGRGEELPVSAMPADGRFETGTAQFEKRNLALEIPTWDNDLCIQCGKCVIVCPHAAIREKVVSADALIDAPLGYLSAPAKWRQFPDQRFTLQVATEDCTGCTLCHEVCPAVSKADPNHRALMMKPQAPLVAQERINWDFFQALPEVDRSALNFGTVKDAALAQPLFEFSGACAGCGETPYIRLLTQLHGDHLVVANATGCSSIFGGNLPTTPWSKTRDGVGPAWANSLFEDNAEFGLGIRVALDARRDYALALIERTIAEEPALADPLMAIVHADQKTEAGIRAQRERVNAFLPRLKKIDTPLARELESVIESAIHRSVWLVGGDGWAYDIGYGGLDHVLASGQNVNILVLDTEVYSNTGGQQSKATPRGATAKFASGGKPRAKKDLGLLAMTYGNVYVAQIAMGSSDAHTVRALQEAEAFDGPSLIIAFSHCIAHGYELSEGLDHQKAAVNSGYWPLYRYNPAKAIKGENPFSLDSKAPTIPIDQYLASEGRFKVVNDQSKAVGDGTPDEGSVLANVRHDVNARWNLFEQLSKGWRLA